jgi:hypothetical protein
MSDREAWVWMIARAAWAETAHKVGNEMVAVPRGAFFCTLRELQSAWMWGSDTKVRNFLKRLETALMIRWETVAKGNAQKTQVTICNYEVFQAYERTENAKENAWETHGKRTKETKEQDNKRSEGKPSLALVPKPTRFPEFWAAYPHRGGAKKGRKPSEAKYLAAIKAGASEQDIIDGARRSAQDRQVRAGFARDPTTWLGQCGWEDEIDVARENHHGTGSNNGGTRPGPHNAMLAGFALASDSLKRGSGFD